MATLRFGGGDTQTFLGRSCASLQADPSLAQLFSRPDRLGCFEDTGVSVVSDEPPPLLNTSLNFGFWDFLGGAFTDLFGNRQPMLPPPPSLPPPGFAGGAVCPEGTIGTPPICVDIFPGGPTTGEGLFVPAVNGRGAGTTSAVGTPATPGRVGRSVRQCPRGHVLADLGNGVLCYHRKLIPNSLRLYPKPQAPALSARDKRMIKKYAKGGTKATQIADLAKELGYHVASNPHRKRAKK